MRAVGIDLGERRIGLAVSDPTGTIARPVRTIERDRSDASAARTILAAVDELSADERIDLLVIGLPVRLDGSETDQTRRVRDMIAALGARTTIPIETQDERLSSHEADERLAFRERDWRKRKQKLDAASAAVILQDYLDGRMGSGLQGPDSSPDPKPGV
jgi:putative Holliday junction resolvase